MGTPERAAQVQSEPLPQVLVPKRWHPPKNTEVLFLKVELCVRSLTCAWRKGPSSCLPQPDQNSLSFLRWLPGLPSAYLACLGGWVWLLTLLISGARAWENPASNVPWGGAHPEQVKVKVVLSQVLGTICPVTAALDPFPPSRSVLSAHEGAVLTPNPASPLPHQEHRAP